MMENIEEEASHSDTHSNALEAPRALQTLPDEDNYCMAGNATDVAIRGKYESTATMQSQNKRSRAGTIDQQNHNTFHSKLASSTSDALASCQLEEKNFYE